jgi:pimeloyl-ACP methyl ester carboxylesterase
MTKKVSGMNLAEQMLSERESRSWPTCLLSLIIETNKRYQRSACMIAKSILADKWARRGNYTGVVAGLGASAALAATALLVRRSAQRAEERHPPIGHFVTVDRTRLHYLEYGSGEPVVLLHGNGTSSQDFFGSGLVEQLASRYRVIAFDRPGFGYSDRPRLRVWTPEAQAELLLGTFTLLGIEHPVIVAHSWGTLVALAMGAQRPQALRGMLLISGYYYPTPKLDTIWQSTPAIPVVGDVMRYTVSPLLGRIITPFQIRKMFWPQEVPEAFRKEVPLELQLRPWQLRAAAADSALMVFAAARLARHYRDLTLPITIAAGTEDRIADFSTHSARLHDELPQSELMELQGVGHMLHYAVPDKLAFAVDVLQDIAKSQVAESS